MTRVKSPLLAAIPLILFLSHHLIQSFTGLRWPLINGYLDPLCFIPVLFTAWLWELGWLFEVRRMSGSITLIAGTILIVFVEEIFPRHGPGFTHDWWDYPAYFLGLAYFWFFINPDKTVLYPSKER